MKKRILPILCAALCFGLVVAALWSFFGKSNREPVVIAIIDTGISTEAIPGETILEGKNYFDPSLTTQDTYGHGTAVASVILEYFPQAQLVPLVSNVYDEGKIRQVSNDVFAQMIRDAVDVYGCDIINISAGLVLDKPAVREAVGYAEEKGVLVVASAGNDYATNGEFAYFPARYDTVVAVGSVTKDYTAISAFSQRGDWVDIYACGEEIEIKTISGSTRESEGTSYSTAFVTARAARILQKNRNLTPAKLRESLFQSAKELPDGSKYIR